MKISNLSGLIRTRPLKRRSPCSFFSPDTDVGALLYSEWGSIGAGLFNDTSLGGAISMAGIKSDKWIRRMASVYDMIEPFEPGQVRYRGGSKIISYGTSSYGYDIRCADEFKIFTNINSAIVDPKNSRRKAWWISRVRCASSAQLLRAGAHRGNTSVSRAMCSRYASVNPPMRGAVSSSM